MDEDTIIPLSADGQPEKKKRGRKPKLRTETPAAADAAEKPVKKRGRPKKIKPEEAAAPADAAESAVAPAPSGPQWRDMPPSEPEHYSPENEIFTGSDGGDDFAYSKSGHADSRGDDGEIPQYFSTSDEDLDPDSYRSRPEPEAENGGDFAADSGRDAPRDPLPLSDPSYESFAEAEAARQDRRNNRRNWRQNPRDNPRGAGQNRQQQNQKFQQNRNGGQNSSSKTRTASSKTSRDSSRAAGRTSGSRAKTGSSNSRKRNPHGNRPTPTPRR